MAQTESNQEVAKMTYKYAAEYFLGERGGSVVERRTPEREVGGSKPTSAVLYPLKSKPLYSPKSTGNTQEAVAPSRHD